MSSLADRIQEEEAVWESFTFPFDSDERKELRLQLGGDPGTHDLYLIPHILRKWKEGYH